MRYIEKSGLESLDEGYFYDLLEHKTVAVIEERDLKHAKDHLRGILEAFYMTGDIEALEFSLEEVCHVMDVEFEPKDIKLTSRTNENISYLQGYKDGVKHMRKVLA